MDYLVWFIDALLTINIPTDPDELFFIVISHTSVNNNNKIKSLEFRF
jgi:hypothetical protein